MGVIDVQPRAVAQEAVVGVLDRKRVVGVEACQRRRPGMRVHDRRGQQRRMQIGTFRRENPILGLGAKQGHALIVGSTVPMVEP